RGAFAERDARGLLGDGQILRIAGDESDGLHAHSFSGSKRIRTASPTRKLWRRTSFKAASTCASGAGWVVKTSGTWLPCATSGWNMLAMLMRWSASALA